MLFALASCSPDNIKAPIEQDPVTPETENKQPEPEIQKPQDNIPVSTEPVQPETETNDKPEVPDAGTETEDRTKPQTSSYIPADKKQNKDVKPSFDIDTLSFVKLKTPELKNKTLSMYVTKDGAFSAGGSTEAQWLDSLKDAYGISVEYTLHSDSMLCPAQLIKSKAGIGPDLITAKVNDAASLLSLMQSVTDIGKDADTPFSKTVFDITDGKMFTGIGNSRMLWYNKNIIKDDSPYTLFCANSWTADVMNAAFISAKTTKTAMLENTGDWLVFLSTGSEQATGYTKQNGAVMMITDDAPLNAAKTYSKLFKTENALASSEHAFIKGNVAFTFTDKPSFYNFEVGFAPLPKASDDGSMVAELCGTGIGVSKYIAEDKKDTALTFAVLWSTRYTESRMDTLLFDLKLSQEAAEKYLDFTERNGKIYVADSQIADIFISDTFPAELAADSQTVYNTFYKAYNRTVLLNKRYR